MKKFARILSAIVTALSLVLTPAVVHAQVDPVEIGDSTDTTIPTTGGTDTPATPDTGIAPQDNKVLANLSVFVVGSAIGAAVGFGILTVRKKRFNQ